MQDYQTNCTCTSTICTKTKTITKTITRYPQFITTVTFVASANTTYSMAILYIRIHFYMLTPGPNVAIARSSDTSNASVVTYVTTIHNHNSLYAQDVTCYYLLTGPVHGMMNITLTNHILPPIVISICLHVL